ncbi:MAG: hypothetical protein GY799_25260 [Desulfobulbaceae bacterium]|nr:hypothetical protein [Desulfobulbaceae bacterium]
MTTKIKRNNPLRLEIAVNAVLLELNESRNTSLLLAKAVMNSHAVVADDKTGHPYYQCIHCNGRSRGYEYHDGEIKHEKGCPVLAAMLLLGESTES